MIWKDWEMKFEDWFWQIEDCGIKADRFWNDVNNNNRREIFEWIKNAYEMGYKEGSQAEKINIVY